MYQLSEEINRFIQIKKCMRRLTDGVEHWRLKSQLNLQLKLIERAASPACTVCTASDHWAGRKIAGRAPDFHRTAFFSIDAATIQYNTTIPY